GRDRQRVRPGMREDADIAAYVGEHEERGAGDRAARSQMTLGCVQPNRATARKNLQDFIGRRFKLAKLWKSLRQERTDLGGVELRLQIRMRRHRGDPDCAAQTDTTQRDATFTTISSIACDWIFRCANPEPIQGRLRTRRFPWQKSSLSIASRSR